MYDRETSALSELDREQLGAYLDGELDAESTLALERRLENETSLRAELEQLSALDGVLDRLPASTVGPAFTESTVEIVALRGVREEKAAPRRWAAAAAVLVALAAAGWFGYAVASAGGGYDDQLARDLPLLQRLDAYQNIQDVEFLRLLDSEGVFSDAALEGGAEE